MRLARETCLVVLKPHAIGDEILVRVVETAKADTFSRKLGVAGRDSIGSTWLGSPVERSDSVVCRAKGAGPDARNRKRVADFERLIVVAKIQDGR